MLGAASYNTRNILAVVVSELRPPSVRLSIQIVVYHNLRDDLVQYSDNESEFLNLSCITAAHYATMLPVPYLSS
jgi:hypothetical protein